jgi:hypothetical protein
MATLTTAVNTTFTPAAGDFIVQVAAGDVQLERRNTSSAPWVPVGPKLTGAWIVSNPVAAADYRFTTTSQNATVQADQ